MPKTIFDDGDYTANRIVGSLGYLFFFIPLFAAPKSAFGKFCANQGLLLFLGHVALTIVWWPFSYIPFLGMLMSILINIARVLFGIIGIYYMALALQNDVREIPYIGQYKIFK